MRQIPSDGFDSRLEPIGYITGGCWLDKRKLTMQSPSITVEFSVQHDLKLTSVIYSFANFNILILTLLLSCSLAPSSAHYPHLDFSSNQKQQTHRCCILKIIFYFEFRKAPMLTHCWRKKHKNQSKLRLNWRLHLPAYPDELLFESASCMLLLARRSRISSLEEFSTKIYICQQHWYKYLETGSIHRWSVSHFTIRQDGRAQTLFAISLNKLLNTKLMNLKIRITKLVFWIDCLWRINVKTLLSAGEALGSITGPVKLESVAKGLPPLRRFFGAVLLRH